MYPQSLAWMDAKSHYICLIFLPCVFSNDVPNCLHLWSITTHVALFHVGFSPECAVMVFYVLSQNVVRYHISTTQISNKMCWNYFSPECGVVLFKRAFKFTAKEDAMSHWLHWIDMSSNTFSFMVTKTSMWFFKIEPLSTYFTRFLLRLGFVPLVVPSESGCLPSLRKAQKRCPTLFRDRVSERYTSKKICKTMHDLVKMIYKVQFWLSLRNHKSLINSPVKRVGQCAFSFKLNRRNKPRTVEN